MRFGGGGCDLDAHASPKRPETTVDQPSGAGSTVVEGHARRCDEAALLRPQFDLTSASRYVPATRSPDAFDLPNEATGIYAIRVFNPDVKELKPARTTP